MEKFNEIYNSIQDVTNEINICLGFEKLQNKELKQETIERMERVQELANKLADESHELLEHFCWD